MLSHWSKNGFMSWFLEILITEPVFILHLIIAFHSINFIIVIVVTFWEKLKIVYISFSYNNSICFILKIMQNNEQFFEIQNDYLSLDNLFKTIVATVLLDITLENIWGIQIVWIILLFSSFDMFHFYCNHILQD